MVLSLSLKISELKPADPATIMDCFLHCLDPVQYIPKLKTIDSSVNLIDGGTSDELDRPDETKVEKQLAAYDQAEEIKAKVAKFFD